MNVSSTSPPLQNLPDMTQLQQLQSADSEAGSKDPQKLKQASQDFESILLQQMLEEMDKTVDRSNSIFGQSSAEGYFRSMLNQEIAKSMSSRPGGSGFGLADAIYHQLSKKLKAPPPQPSPARGEGT